MPGWPLSVRAFPFACVVVHATHQQYRGMPCRDSLPHPSVRSPTFGPLHEPSVRPSCSIDAQQGCFRRFPDGVTSERSPGGNNTARVRFFELCGVIRDRSASAFVSPWLAGWLPRGLRLGQFNVAGSAGLSPSSGVAVAIVSRPDLIRPTNTTRRDPTKPDPSQFGQTRRGATRPIPESLRSGTHGAAARAEV
eukprot:gene22069-biopygen2701